MGNGCGIPRTTFPGPEPSRSSPEPSDDESEPEVERLRTALRDLERDKQEQDDNNEAKFQRLTSELEDLRREHLELQTQAKRDDKSIPLSDVAEAKSPEPAPVEEEAPVGKAPRDDASVTSGDGDKEEDNTSRSYASETFESESEDEGGSQAQSKLEDRAVLVRALDDRPAQDIKDGLEKFSEDYDSVLFVQGEGKTFMVIFDNREDTVLQELCDSLESQFGEGAVEVTSLTESSAIYVTNLPSDLHEDHLRLSLESKIGRPNSVCSVDLDANVAVATVVHSSVALELLKVERPEVCGKPLQIYPYFDGFGPFDAHTLSVPLREKHVTEASDETLQGRPQDDAEDASVHTDSDDLGFSQRVLLASGVSHSSPATKIKNLVECISDYKVKTSFLGEQGKVLLIFYGKAPDPERFTLDVRQEPECESITLAALEDTDTVMVVGLPSSLSEMHLRYDLEAFLGHREPGVVKSIEYDHDGKDRTIAFANLTSPKEALQLVSVSRERKFKVFQVYLYFKHFGALDIFEGGSVFRIPGPLSFPIADQHIYQYLQRHSKTVESFSDSLTASYAQVCVSEGEMALTARCLLTSGNLTLRRHCPSWRQETETEVITFLANYSSDVIQVFPGLWPRVEKALADEDLTTAYTDAEMVKFVAEYQIVARGCCKAVTLMSEKVKSVVLKLEKEEEVFTQLISVSEEEARLQEKLDLYRIFQREHPWVSITREQQFTSRIDVKNAAVCFSVKGKDKAEVLLVKKKFEQWRDRVAVSKIYTVDDAVAAMYNRKTVQDYIDQLLRSEQLHATYQIVGKELNVYYSPEARKGATIQKLVRESVRWKIYHVTIGEMGQLISQDLTAYTTDLEKELGGFAGSEGSPVTVHWRKHGMCVIVISTRQHFNTAVEKFEKFLEPICSSLGEESSRSVCQTRKVELQGVDEAEYAERFLAKELVQIQTEYVRHQATVELTNSKECHFVKVSAPLQHIDALCKTVQEMVQGISKRSFCLEAQFCGAVLKEPSGEAFLSRLERDHACVLKLSPETSSPDAATFTLVHREQSEDRSMELVDLDLEETKEGEEGDTSLSAMLTKKLQDYVKTCIQKEEVDITSVGEAELHQIIKQSVKEPSLAVVQEGSKIIIEGLKMPTVEVAKKMEKSFSDVRERQVLSESVKWKYKGNDGRWKEYDPKVSGEIEQAIRLGKTLTFQRGSESVTVDVYAMEEVSSTGERRPVQRQDLRKANSIDPPDHWEPVTDPTDAEYFEVDGSTGEYKEVTHMFEKTLGRKCVIHQVHRVQNLKLYQLYAVRRLQMEKRPNIPTNFERDMWHGSDKDTLGIICKGGFNRSYGGRNAMVYGEGSYFAVNSSYSANPTYAKPDGSGRQRMLRCKVLAGLLGLGNGGMKEPPFIDGVSGPRYDSCTDGGNQMCIVFYDNQAYPEYEITFSAQ